MKYDTNKNPVELAGSKIENSSEGNDIDVAKNVGEFENININEFDGYDEEYEESNSYSSERALISIIMIAFSVLLAMIVISFIVRQVEIKAEHMTMQGMIINLFLS